MYPTRWPPRRRWRSPSPLRSRGSADGPCSCDSGGAAMTATAVVLADWAHRLAPDDGDLALAGRSLADTVAVALAARRHPVTRLAAGLPDAARWAVAGHVLDFDDLHMQSTAHVSVVCVPTALVTGGGARGYLAAAGVMARIGAA